MKRNISLICLALVALLILASCGGAGGGAQNQTTAATAAASAETTTTAAGGGDAQAGADNTEEIDKTKITSWDDPNLSWKQVKDTPVTIGCYIDFDWYALDTWGKDDVSKEITKRTGITLNVHKSSDLNQLGVLFAADELPDMMFTTNQIERFYDTDFVWPYDELIELYCPEFMNLIDPVEIVNNTQSDGHFYTLKSHYNSAEAWADPRNLPSPGSSHVAWRQDICDELGIGEIKSIEDLMDAFAIVKAEKPDMIVYAPQSQWSNAIGWFMGVNGEGAGVTIKDDGIAYLMYDSPGQLEWLQLLNSMVRNGYVDPEFYIYQTQQWEEIINQGIVFCATYNSGVADRPNKYFSDNNIEGPWYVHPKEPLTWKGEVKLRPVDGGIGWSNLFITKNCKNPDRAIQYMEFLKSPEGDALTQWGIEGYHYTLSPDGLIKRPDNFPDMKDTGIGPWYFMASGLGEGVAVMSGKIGPTPQFTLGVDSLAMIKPYYYRDPAQAFIAPKPDTDEFNIRTKLSDLYNSIKIDLYSAKSDEEFMQIYEKFCADAEQIGASKLLDHYKAAYAEAKKRYE